VWIILLENQLCIFHEIPNTSLQVRGSFAVGPVGACDTYRACLFKNLRSVIPPASQILMICNFVFFMQTSQHRDYSVCFAACLAICTLTADWTSRAQTLAFPGAQGFGKYATGGRNGTVYHVTSLADSGAGTFRDAVSTPNRTIVFDIGGTITVASAVSCSSDLTIAGQTAPGGIAIIGHEVSFSVLTNEIVRFLRIRPGSIAGSTEDAINMGDGTNMIFDHDSVEFAPYNNIDAHGNYTCGNQITIQNSILADPIGQQFNAHTEALYNTFSWCYDIFSSAHDRNPLAKVNTIFVNNVVYNFQAGYTVADTSGHFSHDIVNNYFITGPSTTSAGDDFFQFDTNQSVYATGNLLDTDDGGALGGSLTTPNGAVVLDSPWSSLTTTIPAFSTTAAYKNDVSLSGALPRDQVDQLVINDVNSLGTSGQMWTNQTATGLGNNGYGTITGGATPLNTSGDGIPDYWKLANGLNVSIAYPLTNTADGYTLLEHYLNWLAVPHVATGANTPVSIPLAQYTAGFAANPTYTVGGVSNGVVTLTNGSTAIFSPTTNFSGLGGFYFIVSDGATTQTNSLVVCVSTIPQPLSVIWRGDNVLNNWDTVSTNWLNGTNLEVFAQDDTVTFSDTGSDNPAINLVGTLPPAAINVIAAQNYAFSGNGALGGSALFTKSGLGTLTINTTNSSYSGNFNITGGTLAIGNSADIGSGNFILGSNSTVNLLGGSVLLTAPGTITVAAGNTATLASAQLGNEYSGNLISGDSNSVLNLSGGVSFNGSASSQFSSFTGTINIPSGSALRFAVASSGNSFGSLNPSFIINGTLQPRNAGNTITLGTLNGSGQLAGPQTSGTGSGSTVYIVGGNNENGSFSGTIVSNSASAGSAICFEKVGSGMQVLNDNNTITGTNAVTDGTLVLNGINDNWLTTVFSGATLEGLGVINGAVTVNSGGILVPGTNGTGTLTINGALTNNSPTLDFGLTNTPAGANGLINLAGPLVLSGEQTFNFTLTGGTLDNGTYPLISGGSSMALSGVTFADNLAPDARQTYTLTTPSSGSDTGYVSLVAAGMPPASLTWQGTNGSSWDLTTTNWLNNSSADKFYNLDNVTFNDNSTNGAINLAVTLQPGSILVTNNTLAYTFGGDGELTGAGTLTKSGAGTLSILVTNASYTGNVVVSGGMLAIGNSLALGHGALTLSNGATFDLITENAGYFYGSSIFVQAGQLATLNSSALGNGFEGDLSSGDTTSVLNITGGVSFGATNSAQFDGFTGTINIQSGATLRFSANSSGNTYGSLNPTLIINGTLQPRNAGNTIQLGALSGSGVLKGPQSDQGSGNTLYVIGGNNSPGTFSGLIQSNTAVAGSAVLIEKVGSGELTLSGNNTYGGTTVTAGTLSVDNTTGSGTGSGNLEIMDGATLCGTGIVGSATTMDDYSILAPGNPTGTLTFSNNLSLQNTSILLFGLGTNSGQVDVNGSLFIAGSLTVTNSGGFRVGSYTLFTCNPVNGLSFGSLTISSAPPGFYYSINTNTPGAVILVAAPTTPPVIGTITSSGSDLVMAGANGVPLGNYIVLSSTNLALPLSNWTPILTNQFDGYGRFCVTNSTPTNNAQNFYVLELP
jgi:autotransporter-associated beta strand protein